MARIVIAGCGYVGTALALELVDDGHEVFGLRRDPSRLPQRVEPLAADLSQRESTFLLPEGVDFAVYCVSPDSGSEKDYRTAYLDGLERFLRNLKDQGEKPHISLASSTSVYGQHRGEWVDEATAASPARLTAETLVLAERLLLASGFDATVVRFGGIYGPGRTRLVSQVERGEAGLTGEPHFTNRIHRDDAAGILHHLVSGGSPHDLYLGVDCEPADEADVLAFLAEELGVEPPRALGDEEPRPQRRAGSKRCRNDRIRGDGYTFRHPSYREGYREVVAEYLAQRPRAE
jgi:nucleoside-diphosphate-sugar epimerase